MIREPHRPSRLVARGMADADIPGVIALQHRAFPGMPAWVETQLRSHLRHFAAGQLVVDDGGRIVGSARRASSASRPPRGGYRAAGSRSAATRASRAWWSALSPAIRARAWW